MLALQIMRRNKRRRWGTVVRFADDQAAMIQRTAEALSDVEPACYWSVVDAETNAEVARYQVHDDGRREWVAA